MKRYVSFGKFGRCVSAPAVKIGMHGTLIHTIHEKYDCIMNPNTKGLA